MYRLATDVRFLCTVERLRFRIDHNETVARDISEVLSRIHLPRMQCAVRRHLTPQYLDLQLLQSNDVAEQLSRKTIILMLNEYFMPH